MTHNEMTQDFWLMFFPLPTPYPKTVKILTSSFVSTKCFHMDQLISSSQRPKAGKGGRQPAWDLGEATA